MMHAVEMYMIVITLLAMTRGQHPFCFHYCKLSPDLSSNSRPECDCSLYNMHVVAPTHIKDSSIYYEPTKLNNSSDRPAFHEHNIFYMFNLKSNLNSYPNTSDITNYDTQNRLYNTSESFAGQQEINKHNFKPFHKYNSDEPDPNFVEETKDRQLHLYLDIYFKSSEERNRSQLETLKNMFENFHAAEKDLSECINLHIYIFSNQIDISNQTTTNGGRKVEDNNSSNSEGITEIQNKCDLSTSIIKQNLYQIKQSYPQKEQTFGYVQNEKDDLNNLYVKSTTQPISDAYSPRIGVSSEQPNYIKSNKPENINLFNSNVLPDMINSDLSPNLPIITDKEAISNTTGYNIKEGATDTNTLNDHDDLRTTNKINRRVHDEDDMKIPKIVTKEMRNGTLISVVDGYEDISNSDIITNTIPSTSLDESTISYSRNYVNETTTFKTNITDKLIQSDLVEIQGNLYFLFGNKHIPARFIQQPDGELNVAIDGFSLCDQWLEEEISNYIKSLCHCIQLQDST